MKLSRCVRVTRNASRRGTDCPVAGRPMVSERWCDEQGNEMALVTAYRDVLRVVSAEEGTKFEEGTPP